MSDSLLEFERLPDDGFVVRVRAPRFLMVPAESRQHVRAAQKEMLLALRGLIDSAIECVEEKEKPRTRERRRVEVT